MLKVYFFIDSKLLIMVKCHFLNPSTRKWLPKQVRSGWKYLCSYFWIEGFRNSILSCWLEQREKSEVRQTVFRLKISLLGLRDLWKGLFVAREVRGWCHECQFLHHEGRRVSSKSPEWCKNWHEWHHPLTSSATKSPFQRSRRPKRNWFSAEKQFAATEDFSRCSNQHDRMFFHIG